MPSNGNKRKIPSSSSNSNSSFTVGDIVLAKVKGFPLWPGHVVDEAGVPSKVKKDKPSKSNSHHLIQFFPAGDYAWTAPRDLSHLSTEDIQTYIDSPSKKKAGDLLQAYKTASDPSTWINEREQATADWEALQQNLEAAVDQLAETGAGEEEEGQVGGNSGKGGAAKKRKRKSDGGNEGEKVTKESGSSKKKSNGSEEKGAKKAKLEKLAKGRSSKVGAQSEEEVEPSSKKVKTAPSTGDEEPGLIKVKDWRHKLQKIFLNSKDGVSQPIPANEMPKCKEYFDEMEKFEMRLEWLTTSKLGKVLKRIAALQPSAIPGENDYHFIERSTTIANTWTAQVATEQATAAAAASASGSGSYNNAVAPPPAPVVEAPAPALAPAVVAAAPVVAAVAVVAEVLAPDVAAVVVEAPQVVEDVEMKEAVPAVVVEVEGEKKLIAAPILEVEPVVTPAPTVVENGNGVVVNGEGSEQV